MFYDIFKAWCEEVGESPSRILSNLGISKGSLFRWKEGGEPSNPTKKKIADYFGLTVRQLMSGEIENILAPTESENDNLETILEEARNNPDLRILFSLSSKASPEDVKKYIQMIKLMGGDDNGGSNH